MDTSTDLDEAQQRFLCELHAASPAQNGGMVQVEGARGGIAAHMVELGLAMKASWLEHRGGRRRVSHYYGLTGLGKEVAERLVRNLREIPH